MLKFPSLKPKEAPAPPELLEAEKKAQEAMEEIEQEIEEATRAGGEEKTEQVKDVPVASEPATMPVAAVVPAPGKDPLTQRVESILEEDLTDMYLSLSPADQQAFKQKGEETLSKIRMLLNQTKVNAKKIFQLIREWLKMIPGVNRFFLEQEAKIKTDKILFTKEHE
jgi:hypothetical protein